MTNVIPFRKEKVTEIAPTRRVSLSEYQHQATRWVADSSARVTSFAHRLFSALHYRSVSGFFAREWKDLLGYQLAGLVFAVFIGGVIALGARFAAHIPFSQVFNLYAIVAFSSFSVVLGLWLFIATKKNLL